MLAFARGELRRAGVHDDHRVGPRHPQRQHDHHRPRRRARPGPALPAARPGRPLVAARLRLPAVPASAASCRTSRASGCRRSSTRRSWAPASRSRCPTWRSAARATSSAPSSTATWRRSASTSTPGCWPRRSRRRRRCSSDRRAGHAAGVDGHRPAGRRLPARRLRRRRSRRSWSSTGGWAGRRRARRSTTIRAELVDRFGALPPPVERLLEVARLRIAAEAAGIVSLAREGNELIVRFRRRLVARRDDARHGADSDRRDRLPGVPVGGLTYGSNQIRVRVSRDAAAAWQTTRASPRAWSAQPPRSGTGWFARPSGTSSDDPIG